MTRSAAGRVNIESLWLPSVLCGDDVACSAPDVTRIHARFIAHGENAEIEYTVDEAGILKSVYSRAGATPKMQSTTTPTLAAL